MAVRIELVENYVVPGFTVDPARLVLAEDVRKYGLNPNAFIAAVEADLGVAGVINENERLYQTSEWIPENVKLGIRAPHEFIASENLHPADGPTLNVAARIIRVEVTDVAGAVIRLEQQANGAWRMPLGEDSNPRPWPKVAKARGVLAFTKTTDGSNLWILHQGQMPLGTSSRGFGYETRTVLEAESEHAEANAGRVGQPFGLISGYELVTYDIVPVPSAGTFIQRFAPASEARRAYMALVEARVLPPPANDGGEVHSRPEDLMDLAKLMKEHPELARQIQEAAVAEFKKANPVAAALADADENTKKLATTIIAGVKGESPALEDGKAVAEAVRKTCENLERASQTLRERQTQAEQALVTERTARAEEKKATETRIATLEADLTTRKHNETMGKALSEGVAKVHSNLRERVTAYVGKEITEGRIAKPEDVGPQCERLAELLKGVSESAATPQTRSNPADAGTDTSGSGGSGGAGAEVNETAADPIDTLLGPVLGNNWQTALAERLGRPAAVNNGNKIPTPAPAAQ